MVWIIIIACILIILFVAIYYLTYKVLFFPTYDEVWTPEDKYIEWYIPTDKDYTGEFYHKKENIDPYRPCISTWYFEHFENRPTVLFFHGNAGNISHREYVWYICKTFQLNLLLVDYRGFGKSNGDPSPRGIFNDGLVAYDYLLSRLQDPDQIVIWGESLGSSVATFVASKRRCRCLLLLCPFASLEDVIFRHDSIPWWIKSSGIIIKHFIDNMPSKKYIADVKDPVVIMHSKEDELIPYINAEILKESVTHEYTDLITIEGGHSTPKFNKPDLARLFYYVNKYDRSPTSSFLGEWGSEIQLSPILNLIQCASDDFHERHP